MNGKKETEADNKVSVLFRYYTRKVFSRIRSPEKTKEKLVPSRNTRGGG